MLNKKIDKQKNKTKQIIIITFNIVIFIIRNGKRFSK